MKHSITKSVEEEFIRESEMLFNKYFENTKKFRQKCNENENFWKSEHWKNKPQHPNEPYPSVPTLFSSIENVHAEIMDNYPEAALFPYGSEDVSLAKELSSIIDVTLERCKFASKYRKEMLRLLKRGTCCFSVIWDNSLYDGYGDIDVIPCDMTKFLWDTSQDDIQKGSNVFRFSYYNKGWYKQNYPDKYDLLPEDDENILLIERWYKTYNDDKAILQMAKIAGGVLLEWSEKDPNIAKNGVYNDGLYPFVIIPLYELEGTPLGMGMIDVFKSEQEYIDMLDRIIMKNAMMSGKLRLLKDNRCNIPKEKLADWDEDVLEGSDISERSIRWFQPEPVSQIVIDHLNFKIDCMKRDSGQTDIVRGEYNSGITSASAIVALQNAATKRTRNIVGRIYDKYTDIIHMIISRIAQFYDETRTVYINSDNGVRSEYFIPPKFGIDSRYDFNIKVKAHKKNLYEVTYNNEIIEKLHDNGVITTEDMLDLMNFDGKEIIKSKLKEKVK